MGSYATSPEGHLALWIPLKLGQVSSSQWEFNKSATLPSPGKHQEIPASAAAGWDGPVQATAVQP